MSFGFIRQESTGCQGKIAVGIWFRGRFLLAGPKLSLSHRKLNPLLLEAGIAKYFGKKFLKIDRLLSFYAPAILSSNRITPALLYRTTWVFVGSNSQINYEFRERPLHK
jgi:hypothetical protein